jgi:hypothetical protein
VVLLQGGAVQVLVQALVVPADVIRLGWLTWSCKALMALCDPAISFLPMSFIERWVCLDASNLSSEGELECDCGNEIFPAQSQFLMG